MKNGQQLTPAQRARLEQLRKEQGPQAVETVIALATRPGREPRIHGAPSPVRSSWGYRLRIR